MPILACEKVGPEGEPRAARTEASVLKAGTSGPRYAPGELAGTEWLLVSLQGKAPIGGRRPTTEFDEGVFGGWTGCNSYGSFAASVKDETNMTTIGCSKSIRRQEKAFVGGLDASRTYRLEGDRLKLRDGTGGTVLDFEKKEAA